MKQVLKSILKKDIFVVIIINFLIGITIYLSALPSKILGIIIDLLSNIELNKPIIFKNIVNLLIISACCLVIRIIWKYLIAKITRIFEKDLKDRLFKQFLNINLSSIQNIKNGEIMSYFVKDVGELSSLLYRLLSYGTRIIFTFIIVIYTMNTVNYKLTIAVIIPIIFTSIIVVILKRFVERSLKKSQKYFTKLSEYVQESTDSIRTTKAYSGEINQCKKFVHKNTLLKRSNIVVDKYSTLLRTSILICFGICYSITLFYGSRLVLNNEITIGEFVAFNGYIDMFYAPIVWLPGIISKIERGIISYNRLDTVFKLKAEPLKFKKENKRVNNTISGDIKIKNLSFSYSDNIERVLSNINIEIKKNTTLGIIGTIGSGKTTLMNLLLRLYNVPKGKIFIDGVDINDIDLRKLRNNICYITQDNFLFSTTIKENIKLFKDVYDDVDIEKSTEKAMFKEDLNNMNDRLDTIIGERGIDLSGGQKQRVVISRAFLNKSNFIIFDDTFSALDNKTEKSLLKNIKELVKDKTCIIISNRISDVKDADHIIVLEHGSIVEEGTHLSLINNSNGLYKKFYDQQSSNVEEDILS